MRPLLIAACAALLTVPAQAQNTRYEARGAGKVTIKYNTPRFRPELMLQARRGVIWRLGANAATTIESTAALVWSEGVVFPGSYNLGAAKIDDVVWNLIFHRDGSMFRAKDYGQFKLRQGILESKKDHADRLQIDLYRSRDKAHSKAGGATFRVRFGRHKLEGSLHVLGVARKKVRLGRASFQLEAVKLPATPDWQKVVDGDAERSFTFARITLKGDETRVALEPGVTPVLKLLDFNREVTGDRLGGKSEKSKLEVKVAKDTMSVRLGPTEVTFPFTKSLLSKAQTGGTTDR